MLLVIPPSTGFNDDADDDDDVDDDGSMGAGSGWNFRLKFQSWRTLDTVMTMMKSLDFHKMVFRETGLSGEAPSAA